jgi:hypothetical protein
LLDKNKFSNSGYPLYTIPILGSAAPHFFLGARIRENIVVE